MYLVLSYFILSVVSAHSLLFLGLNEICKNGTDPWTCKTPQTCKGLKNYIEKGDVKLCSFIGRQPIICCPPELQGTANEVHPLTSQPEAGKKAELKCREYAKYVYREVVSPLFPEKKMKIDSCVRNSQLITAIGGTNVTINELPHMALIGVQRNGSGSFWFCGGSLISPNFVLTAAHCFLKIKDKVVVRLGELDIQDSNDGATPIDVKVTEIINHPLFRRTKAYHDISLLRLEKELELGPSIRPLCLQTKRNNDQFMAIASGWGYTSVGPDSATSSILQKVHLPIFQDDECVEVYGTHWPKVSKGIETEIMVCSGGTRGVDTCKGDSGGPLQIILKEPYCMYSQIGVTSFGIGCGSITPGVYTRVSAYVSWIEGIVWP